MSLPEAAQMRGAPTQEWEVPSSRTEINFIRVPHEQIKYL